MTPTMTLLVARALCAGYEKAHTDFLASVEVVEVETEFVVPLRNPMTESVSTACALTGRADKLVKVADRLWLMDHKCSSRVPDRAYLKISAQGDTYIQAYQERGYTLDGVIWDYIRRPSIRQTQKETEEQYSARLADDIVARPDFYFTQVPVKRWAEDIAASQYDVWMTHEILLQCHRNGKWPRNTCACYGNYGECAYLQLCADDNAITRSAFCKRTDTQPPDDSKRLESYSSLTQFRTCPRLYFWKQIEMLQPIEQTEAQSLGKEVHSGLDVLYQHGDLDKHFSERLAAVVQPQTTTATPMEV